MFGGAGGVPGLDEFIPDAEPPDEREREQRRFGDGDMENTARRADHKEQQNQELSNPPACGERRSPVTFFLSKAGSGIDGGSAAEHGEQRLQGSQRHDTGIV